MPILESVTLSEQRAHALGYSRRMREGTLRRDPIDERRLQRLRGGVWMSARAWLVPAADGGGSDFHVTEGDEEPPAGAQLIEDAIALLDSLQPQSNARKTVEAARLRAAARFLLDVICLLEPEERWSWFVEPVLPVIRRVVGAPPDATPFEAALGELTGAGLVRSVVVGSDVGPVEQYHVDALLESAMRAGITFDRRHQMLSVLVDTWGSKFLDEEAAPTGTTVRAGVATAVYLRRCGQNSLAFEWLEQKVLPVARRTGESDAVLQILRNLALERGV
jgi:hypothetical protein